MYVVRKITRTKWAHDDQLIEGVIHADAVTADLRTSNNALSLWTCDAGLGASLDDVILALMANADRVDKIDVVWLDRARLEEAGVVFEQTPGKTLLEELSDRHVDAVRLDYVRLGDLACEVNDALREDRYKRVTKKKVAQLIAGAVDSERLSADDLQEKVRMEVLKYTKNQKS